MRRKTVHETVHTKLSIYPNHIPRKQPQPLILIEVTQLIMMPSQPSPSLCLCLWADHPHWPSVYRQPAPRPTGYIDHVPAALAHEIMGEVIRITGEQPVIIIGHQIIIAWIVHHRVVYITQAIHIH